jgi:hypothetical protein
MSIITPPIAAPEDIPFVVTPKQVAKFAGATALGLPILLLLLTWWTPVCFMASISHFYYTPVGGNVLVGSLSVIGAIMMFFYKFKGDEGPENKAYSRRNARLAKIAGACALGVAFVPTTDFGCQYDGQPSRFFLADTQYTVPEGEPRTIYAPGAEVTGTISNDFWGLFGVDNPILDAVHYLSALGMFLILAYFSFFVFTQVQTPAATESHTLQGAPTDIKQVRNAIYRAMGIAIALSIVALAVKAGVQSFVLKDAALVDFQTWWNGYRLTFVFEAIALIAFGVSWLVKARILRLLEDTGGT